MTYDYTGWSSDPDDTYIGFIDGGYLTVSIRDAPPDSGTGCTLGIIVHIDWIPDYLGDLPVPATLNYTEDSSAESFIGPGSTVFPLCDADDGIGDPTVTNAATWTPGGVPICSSSGSGTYNVQVGGDPAHGGVVGVSFNRALSTSMANATTCGLTYRVTINSITPLP